MGERSCTTALSILSASCSWRTHSVHPGEGCCLCPGMQQGVCTPRLAHCFQHSQPVVGGVWSLFFPDILGQEASDGQKDVPISSCHSCAEFDPTAQGHPTHSIHVSTVLLQTAVLLHLSYPSQHPPPPPAAARLLPFGFFPFSYASFMLNLIVGSWFWIVLVHGKKVSSVLLYVLRWGVP